MQINKNLNNLQTFSTADKVLRSLPKLNTSQTSKKITLLWISGFLSLVRVPSLLRVEGTCIIVASSSKMQKVYKNHYAAFHPLHILSGLITVAVLCWAELQKNKLYKA